MDANVVIPEESGSPNPGRMRTGRFPVFRGLFDLAQKRGVHYFTLLRERARREDALLDLPRPLLDLRKVRARRLARSHAQERGEVCPERTRKLPPAVPAKLPF